MKYDILLCQGRVVDPVNGVDQVLDLGIKDGRIVELAGELKASDACQHFELQGHVVVPGLIDTHVHVSDWIGGAMGHKMMAKGGVTTAVDFAGPVESVLKMARTHGTGLNLACINYVRPGRTVPDTDPSWEELEEFLLSSLAKGAIGCKLLGGHYPLTPEATARALAVANKHRVYVAFHAGTLATGSDFNGFREALQLGGDNRFHLAHVNSYCRGRVYSPLREAEAAMEILAQYPNLVSESYLSPLNGTSAACRDGVPESHVTRNCLEMGGFPPTEEGFIAAVRAGWAQINVEVAGVNRVAVGEEALRYWRERGTDTTVSFAVNPGETRYLVATAKDGEGRFVVDAISTDGGGIPRNSTIELGLALVRWGGLTLAEFVTKASANPAAMLGLKDKGHLGLGADADITVVDWQRSKPHLVIVGGRLVMFKGVVMGQGATFITTAAGEKFVRGYGLDCQVIDPAASGLYGGV